VKALLAGQTPLSIAVAPASLTFVRTADGTAPAQTAQLALSDTTKTATFTATTATSWLTVSPRAGSIPANLTVVAAGTNLAAGTYTGTVTAAVSGTTNSPLSIPVTMVVTAQPSIVATPATIAFGAGANTGGPTRPGDPTFPTPPTTPTDPTVPPANPGGQPGQAQAGNQTVQVLATAAGASFTTSVSGSTCGNFLTVTPASATAPATLTVAADLTNVTATSCTATITITSAGLASATVAVTAAVQTTPARVAPTITSVRNGASFATGTIAPGSIVTIFGTNLGPPTATAGQYAAGVLTTSLAGAQIAFDGVAAPILYLSSTQASVVAPMELSGKKQTGIQVSLNGLQSTAVQVNVAEIAPGIFTADSSGTGAATALNQPAGLPNATTSAAKGATVSVYLTGAGGMNPAGRTGALASAQQSITATPAATVGGAPAAVSYAGSIAGSLYGIYRVDLVVPSATASGKVPLVIAIGGVAAQTGVTLNVQ
jgi:trimeric autotransporter adhesin